MLKTLVIILGETRAHELTFNNFKKNVIDVLNADLCLCIGIKNNYDYNNPFYKLSKYNFLYNEPEDYGDAFDYAYDIISKDRPKYEDFKNDDGLNISKKPLHWRNFLKIKDQFLGGILDKKNQHPGSAAILIFFRWFLLKNLYDNNLIYNSSNTKSKKNFKKKYDRFIITRSDFIYELPHPKLNYMDEKNIWIPDSEYYGGYTDRHVILSNDNIESYLNILNNMVLKSNEYFMKMKIKENWNLEQLIKFNLKENNVLILVKLFPYIMYSVRNINGTTRWQKGTFSKKLGYYIKYENEYKSSLYFKELYVKSKLTIDEFYKKMIKLINILL
jgi:hypothetical protein